MNACPQALLELWQCARPISWHTRRHSDCSNRWLSRWLSSTLRSRRRSSKHWQPISYCCSRRNLSTHPGIVLACPFRSPCITSTCLRRPCEWSTATCRQSRLKSRPRCLSFPPRCSRLTKPGQGSLTGWAFLGAPSTCTALITGIIFTSSRRSMWILHLLPHCVCSRITEGPCIAPRTSPKLSRRRMTVASARLTTLNWREPLSPRPRTRPGAATCSGRSLTKTRRRSCLK
mmetsp:Transcript_27377/g.60550  ORF Transcript_27377/g.60550 Transcript_27377/m.60550 type:complete len:231 (+) Transcript_27377:347-1039(+)